MQLLTENFLIGAKLPEWAKEDEALAEVSRRDITLRGNSILVVDKVIDSEPERGGSTTVQ